MEVQMIALIVCLAMTANASVDKVHAPDAHDVGVGPKPVKESPEMKDFKSSLTPEQLQTLKNHFSKSRFIQALLGQQQVVDKRDQVDVAMKINPALAEYYKQLTPYEQELVRKYPSAASHLLKAVQDRQTAEAAGEAAEEAPEVQKREVNGQDWSVILRDMLTHTNALREVLQEAADQHQLNSPSKEELKNKLVEDVRKAKEKGLQLKDLLKILNIPESAEPQPYRDHLKTK